MRSPSLRLALLALCAAVLAAGCGRQRPAPPPAAPPKAGGFPITVRDALGVTVQIARRPRRIVSVAPSVTEILFAIGAGDRVVAACDPADYPPEAGKLPRVGGWFTPSAEKTLGAEPDLVIGARGNPPDFIASLRKSGCPVFTVDPQTLDGIFTAITDIGRITGAEAGAAAVVEGLKQRLRVIAGKLGDVPKEKRPTAFVIISVNPVWSAGSGTFQDDAIRAAGARNVAAELKGFQPFSGESLLAADPDYLLLPVTDQDQDPVKRSALTDPIIRRLSAARQGRLITLDANPIMRPGPRIVDAIEEMARVFYPDRFKSRPSSSAVKRR
jgi:iron complex transport system substrate-binding protein